MEKNNSKTNKIKKIFMSFIKQNIYTYLFFIVLTLFSEIGLVYLIYNLKILFKYDFINTVNYTQLSNLIIFLAIIFSSNFIKEHYDFKLSNNGLIYLEKQQLHHLIHSKLETIDKVDKIELLQQINNDCVVVSDFYISKIVSLFVKILKLVILIYMLSKLSLISMIMLFIVISFYIVLFTFTKNIYKSKNFEMLDSQKKYFSVLGGELLNIFLIKANSWYTETINKFEKAGLDFVKKSISFLDFDYFISNFLETISMIIIVLFPVVLLFFKIDIELIFIIILLSEIFIKTFNEIFELLKSVNKNNISMNRLNDLLSISVDNNGSKIIDEISKIEIVDMSFKYYNSDKNIFSNKSFLFEKNNIYIISGENGSGKSTLIKIMLNLLDISKGRILINGENIDNYDMEFIRKNIFSFCEQEPYLIKDTLLNNLNYASHNPKNIEYYKSNKLLNFVNKLDKNFYTELTLTNSNISAGQKQKIGIVRALSKDTANVYIFDEPTSAMDREGIKIFINLMKEMKNNNIIIIVTHENELKEIGDVIYSI